MLCSTSANVSEIIVSDMVSKLRLELIKARNDNATEKFYRFQVFQKLSFLVKISKILKNVEKVKNFYERGVSALRIIRAGTRLTVDRSLPW